MNPFDIPADLDPRGDSPGPREDAMGTGNSPGDGDAAPSNASNNDRIMALERKIQDSESRILDLIAQNAALRTNSKSNEEDGGKKRYTPEELKQFAMEEGGKNQFDAAYHLVDQAKDEILSQVRSEYRQEQTQKFIREYMTSLYPELNNPDSDFVKRVESEQAKLLSNGAVDPTSPDAKTTAFNMALHKVGKTFRKGESGETPAEYSARRRAEEAGGEGAPAGGGDSPRSAPSGRLTNDERATMRNMGLDPDNKDTVRVFQANKRRYSDMRVP